MQNDGCWYIYQFLYKYFFFNHLVFTMLVVVININYKNSQRTTDRAQLDVQSYFSRRKT